VGTDRERDLTVVVQLSARPGGLASFEIVGETMGERVAARWDGSSLSLPVLFHRVAEISMAVEGVYTRLGLRSGEPSFADDPRSIAIELFRSLDKVYSASTTQSPLSSDPADPAASGPERYDQPSAATLPTMPTRHDAAPDPSTSIRGS
jgi:hypothetical protein